MLALKEQMVSIMDAMLGMKQLMESNAATAVVVSSAAEADLTHPTVAHHPIPNMVGRERSTPGHISNPIRGTTEEYTPTVYHIITHHQSYMTMRVTFLPSPSKGSLLDILTRSTRIIENMLRETSTPTPCFPPRGRRPTHYLNPTSRENLETTQRIRTWKDLITAFLRQYQYNSDMAPDQTQLQNMIKRENESFKEYAQRWRDLAAFADLVSVGERIEVGLKRRKFDYVSPIGASSRRTRIAGAKKKEGDAHSVTSTLAWPNPPQTPHGTHQYAQHHPSFLARAEAFSDTALTQPRVPTPPQGRALQAPTSTRPHSVNNAHFGANTARNFSPRKAQIFAPIPMTYGELLPSLIANQLVVVVPRKIFQSPFPKWYNPSATFAYHGGTPGHSIEQCLALKSKVQSLIEAGWFTFQEDGPNIKTNPLANHGGGAVNAIEVSRSHRPKLLKDVTTPRRFIYKALQKAGMIPYGGRREDSCLMHLGVLHDMETCLAGHDSPKTSTPISSVGGRSILFPYKNNRAVPWRYAPPGVRKGEATDISSLSAKVTNITGLSGITRSARVFAAPSLLIQPAITKGKARMTEGQNVKVIPAPDEDVSTKDLYKGREGCGKKEVSLEEADEFLRIIQQSEFKVIEQLNKTPTIVSLLELLMSSEPH
ncbi:uncharacterized protein LOC114401964 [Glycine soja]|uniref:uncharacterized protein LOC114401964 n=1 Tax=Glycine soja TaxID=3848 RepID=UPI00103D91D1|nr:uncharacterized protein LOC114401964 [Glycine soja]